MAIGLINNSTILKPATSSPSLLDDQTPNSSSSSQVLVPLTIFDKAAIDRHVKVLYAFKAPMPSNEVMKEALSRVLLHFPHLAGRFAIDGLGRTCIHLNNEGVRVIETHIQATFENQLPFHPSSELGHLIPPVAGNIEQLLQIQLNRYSCGGLVIGQTAHHRVADGQSMSSFFVAWAKLVRGMDLYPLPYHGRGAIPVPRNPPRVEFAHHSIEFQKTATPDTPRSLSPIENLVTHFSNEFLNRIKEKIVEENNTPKRYSTFECLLAHVWKKVTQARGLDLEESTQIRVAVNGRARIKPAVPMEYFGNLVLWAYPKLKVSQVLKGSHTSVAMAIHEAVTKVDNKYFQSFIDFGEVTKDDTKKLEATVPEIGNSLCPNLEVDSWLRFEFHNLDFGGGGPCAFFPANIQVEGLLIFLPSCREGGGVDVVMSLLPEHVPLFRQISHSLDENL